MKNIARVFAKHCPSFCETLPMVSANIADEKGMRCPSFSQIMGNGCSVYPEAGSAPFPQNIPASLMLLRSVCTIFVAKWYLHKTIFFP
ncbi:MAG: hypothetical protein PUC85_07355 [bacterium]|nr:hypothetical protein [Parabacteroides sp.]MDD6079969.1 hypothetical protein [bacterium]